MITSVVMCLRERLKENGERVEERFYVVLVVFTVLFFHQAQEIRKRKKGKDLA